MGKRLFNKGDRVELVESYSHMVVGDQGTVTTVCDEASPVDWQLIYVRADKGGEIACSSSRLKLLPAWPQKVGDKVRVKAVSYGPDAERGLYAVGDTGKITEVPDLREWRRTYVAFDDGRKWYVNSEDLELITEEAQPVAEEAKPEEAPKAFKNGDRVVFIEDCSGFHNGKKGDLGTIEDEAPDGVIGVRLDSGQHVIAYDDEIELAPVAEAKGEEAAPELAPGVVPFEINGETRYFKLLPDLVSGDLDLIACDEQGKRVDAGFLVALTGAGKVKRYRGVNGYLGLSLNSEGCIKQYKE